MDAVVVTVSINITLWDILGIRTVGVRVKLRKQLVMVVIRPRCQALCFLITNMECAKCTIGENYMLSLSLNIRNPWSQKFKNLWCRVYDTPHKNKFIELEVYKDSSLLAVNFNLTARQSHAGVDIEIGLFGYCLHFNLYDSRHWNYEEGRWMIYTEEEGLH